MPTKRLRRARHRLPSGFEGVGLPERIHWGVYGPVIDENPRAASQTTVYPSWEAWTEFYGRVRGEYLESRRVPGEPACERLYQAIQAGQDPEEVLQELKRERELDDPRRTLWPV